MVRDVILKACLRTRLLRARGTKVSPPGHPNWRVVVFQEDLTESFIMRDQGGPQRSGRVFPARIRLAAVNALKLGPYTTLFRSEVAVRSDQPLEVGPREDQPVLEGRHDAFHINRVVAAVRMDANPMPRGSVGLVVPQAGGVPVVPDEVFAGLPCLHARLHQPEPLLRPLAINRFPGHIVRGQQPSCYVVLLIVGVRKAVGRAPGVAVAPALGLCVDAEGGHHPQPALFDLAPAAARVPLLKNLAGEFEPRVRARPKPFLQRWRYLNFSRSEEHTSE